MKEQTTTNPKWNHPGGKFRRLGPSACSDKEILAIIINSGTKKHTAIQIAEMVLDKFGTFYGMTGKPMYEFLEVEGIGPTKVTQIAAACELAVRILRQSERE